MKPRPFHVALALALFPASAWANSSIGFLMVTVPAVIISLLPVIFIEAPVLSRMLGVRCSWRTSFRMPRWWR